MHVVGERDLKGNITRLMRWKREVRGGGNEDNTL